MAPFLATLISRNFDPPQVADEFRNQWIQPGDVFTVLLILGGDVIALAMAQIAGSGPCTVAFSLGILSISFTGKPHA